LATIDNTDQANLTNPPHTWTRVSDPHPFHANPDPGFEIFADADRDPDLGCEKFADPDPGLHLYQKIRVYLRQKGKKGTLDPDQNADPDPGTQENADPDPGIPKMRIHCGSGSETLPWTIATAMGSRRQRHGAKEGIHGF